MSKRVEGDIIIKRPVEEVFDFCADERSVRSGAAAVISSSERDGCLWNRLSRRFVSRYTSSQ
jgi:hypothetical protein